MPCRKKSSAGDGDALKPSTAASSASQGDLHPEHPRRHKRRTPDEFNGIQVNYCKNPHCANFGIPIGKKTANGTNPYKIVASGKGMPQGYCNGCGEHFPLKSNQGISEELSRMMKALESAEPEPSCPDTSCRNNGTEVSQGKVFYSSFGVTSTGSQRYAPYNPNMVQKMLDMLRVVHNFTLVSATDKKTPAMRPGLADAAISYEDIIYFNK